MTLRNLASRQPFQAITQVMTQIINGIHSAITVTQGNTGNINFAVNYDDTTIKKNGSNKLYAIIPTQLQSDWNETIIGNSDYIKNKPTNLSQFNNNTGFITESDTIFDNYTPTINLDTVIGGLGYLKKVIIPLYHTGFYPATPYMGELIFDIDLHHLIIYNGTIWIDTDTP